MDLTIVSTLAMVARALAETSAQNIGLEATKQCNSTLLDVLQRIQHEVKTKGIYKT